MAVWPGCADHHIPRGVRRGEPGAGECGHVEVEVNRTAKRLSAKRATNHQPCRQFRLYGTESNCMNTNELTLKARSVARCLSYNDDEHQAAAKHLLREMAHRLDTMNIRAHKKADGLLLINGIGKSRFATLKERVMLRLFGVFPREV